MGGTQSTRKLTLDNEDPSNVIKVSDSVVQRLKGNQEEVSKRIEPAVPAQSAPFGQVPPLLNYIYEPSLTSLQLRQEKEAELQKNDLYWQKRINQLEESHEKMNKFMEQEYKTAVTEVKEQFPPNVVHPENKLLCVDGKRAMMDCYKKYPNEPMRCAQEVQKFAECVDKHRLQALHHRA